MAGKREAAGGQVLPGGLQALTPLALLREGLLSDVPGGGSPTWAGSGAGADQVWQAGGRVPVEVHLGLLLKGEGGGGGSECLRAAERVGYTVPTALRMVQWSVCEGGEIGRAHV